MQPLEFGLQYIYVHPRVDTERISDLGNGRPKSVLGNLPFLIRPAHMDWMHIEAAQKGVVGAGIVGHCQLSGLEQSGNTACLEVLMQDCSLGMSRQIPVFILPIHLLDLSDCRSVFVHSLPTRSATTLSVAPKFYNSLLLGFFIDPTFSTGTTQHLSNMGQRGNGRVCQKPSFSHHYSLIITYLYSIKSCNASATFTKERLKRVERPVPRKRKNEKNWKEKDLF